MIQNIDINLVKLISSKVEKLSLNTRLINNIPHVVDNFLVYDVSNINVLSNKQLALPHYTFSAFSNRNKIDELKERESLPNTFVNFKYVQPDHSLQVLLDTGAQVSVIAHSKLKEFNNTKLVLCHDSIRLNGFSNSGFTEPLGTATLYLQAGLRRAVPITFYVLPDHLFKNKTIIGYNDMKQLGIDLSFESYSEGDFRLDLNPETPRWKTMEPEEQHESSIVNKLLLSLQAVLDSNRVVKELNEPCSHPQAAVRIAGKLKTDFYRELNSYHKNYSPEAKKIIYDGTVDLINRKVLVKADRAKCKALVNWVLVRKEGREVRMCIDSVNFNKHLKPVATELTTADQLFKRLKRNGFQFISALDISKAYFCLPFAEEDIGALYVMHDNEPWAFARSPFGLSFLPMHFTLIFEDIFSDLIQQEKILVYFDDILVLSKTLEEHAELLQEVIRRLNKYNFPLNIDKCKFAFRRLKYLGMIIDNQHMRADDKKVVGICNTPTPTNYTELMHLLGLANYIRRFIPYSTELTSDLYSIAGKHIVKKNKKFELTEQAEVTRLSNQLKNSMQSLIELSLPPEDMKSVKFVVHTDASDIGYGGVLSYVDKNGAVRPMSTYRKKFNSYEANYTIPKKELLAVIACVRHWEEFLIHQPFTLFTDHIALIYLLGSETVDHRTVKGWLCDLSRFQYTIKHIKGEDNQFADYLSRQGCLEPDAPKQINQVELLQVDVDTIINFAEVKEDTELMKCIANDRCNVQVNYVTRSGRSSTPKMDDTNTSLDSDDDLVAQLLHDSANEEIVQVDSKPAPNDPVQQVEGDAEQIASTSDSDDDTVIPSSRRLAKQRQFSMDDGESETDDENNNITVTSSSGTKEHLFHYPNAVRKKAASNFFTTPNDYSRNQLLIKAHDADHGSVGSMVRRILNQGYYWTNMHKDAQLYRNTCVICDQWNKIHQYQFLSAKSIDAHYPWEWLQIDLTGPKIKSVRGNEYILVIIDVLTSFVYLRALPNKDASSVGDALIQLFGDNGFPKIVQSDNGSEFTNSLVQDIIKNAAIEHRFSSAYKPSTNGLVERTVGSATQLINKICTEYLSHENWDKLLPSVQLALNTRVSEKNGQTPFFSLHFRNNVEQGILGYDNSKAKPSPLHDWLYSPEFLQLRQLYLNEIFECKQEASAKIRTYLDANKSIAPRVAVGTHVYALNNRTDKSLPLFDGPYIVVGHDDRDNHILKQIKGGLGAAILDRKFPREQIKAVGYRDTTIFEHTRFVESILDERESLDPTAEPGSTQYLVQYRGYPDKKDHCWLEAVEFDDKSIIDRYKAALAKRSKSGSDNQIVKFRAPRRTVKSATMDP